MWEGLYEGTKNGQQGSLGGKLEDGNHMYLSPVPKIVPGIVPSMISIVYRQYTYVHIKKIYLMSK